MKALDIRELRTGISWRELADSDRGGPAGQWYRWLFEGLAREVRILPASRAPRKASGWRAALPRRRSIPKLPLAFSATRFSATDQPRERQSMRPLGILDPSALAGWMGRASIFALPARYEPFGLSVLEAALSGGALVLGDIPSLRENWEGAARFVTPGDDEALRSAIQGLSDADGERKALAARAEQRAQQFTVRRMADEYLGVYRAMLASRSELAAASSGVRSGAAETAAAVPNALATS